MSTKIFKKITGLVVAVCVAIVCFGVYYSVHLSRAKEVLLQKSFYFLVSTDSKVEVGAEFAKLDGGAGYLLQEKGETYVALAVYLSEEDAQTVQENLKDYPTKLLRKGINTLYFKGTQKKNSVLYVNALRTLEGYISVLSECISRLEKGTTQESCKRILALLQRQLAYAQGEYAAYPAFSKACSAWASALTEMGESTVYASELRYLLCEQAETYLRLCEEFRL